MQQRRTTHCVPNLQFQFIEMQEFHAFLKQFCHANLSTSCFLHASHKQHNTIIQLKSTQSGAALNWSDGQKDLSPPWWVTFPKPVIPKPALLYWPETEKWSFFVLLVQKEMPRELQFDSQSNKLLEESKGQRILKLVDTGFSCPSRGCVLLHTLGNYLLCFCTEC